MPRRSGKYYVNNEKKTLLRFGLTPCKGSGSGEIEKEDGYNDWLLCQHKSTDAASYSIQLEDIRKLEYHALVEHKVPCFMIQFLGNDDIFIMLRPEDFQSVYEHLTIPKIEKQSLGREHGSDSDIINIVEDEITSHRKMIKSGNKDKLDKLIEKERQKKDDYYRTRNKRSTAKTR